MYWLQISSGRGPAECCWVIYHFVKHLQGIADQNNAKVSIIESKAGEFPNTLRSALLAIEGERSSEFIKHWQGSIKWVGKSMFRPTHKRNNWFIDVTALVPETQKSLQSGYIKIERMKSSGPGGQHVNSTDSAVRATHIPSGLSTKSQTERSQHLNKKLALARLGQLLEQKAKDSQSNMDQKKWARHNELERGNAVHVFTGQNFKHKK